MISITEMVYWKLNRILLNTVCLPTVSRPFDKEITVLNRVI